VITRDVACCAVCGLPLRGVRGEQWSVHHRAARKAGGTNRPHINLPSNLLLAHGTGSEGCHWRIESNGIWAREFGFKVREGVRLPAEVPVKHAVHGWVTLADDGTWEAA